MSMSTRNFCDQSEGAGVPSECRRFSRCASDHLMWMRNLCHWRRHVIVQSTVYCKYENEKSMALHCTLVLYELYTCTVRVTVSASVCEFVK